MSEIEDVQLALDNIRREIREWRTELTDAERENLRKPLRKDEIIAGFLAAQMKGSPEHHSVNLKTNAKHEVQIDVTVRAAPGTDFETPAQAFAEASRLLIQARETFALAGIAVADSKGAEGGEQA